MNGERTPAAFRRSRHSLFAAWAMVSAAMPASAQPWTLSDALGAPDSVALEGSYRLRYETLDGAFRAGQSGSDEILVARLLVDASYGFGAFQIGAELQDSRAWLADTGTPLGTDDVNAAELLRAYLAWSGKGFFQATDRLELALGRLTLDAGSRRLLARNSFRNTLNTFTGIEGTWTSAGGHRVQAFWFTPTERRPGDFESLLDNDIEADRVTEGTRFWGIYYTLADGQRQWRGEVYLFALREEDRTDLATRDRDLYTPGFRVFRPPGAGVLDWEIETAFQFGDSRLSTSDAGPLLDHSARFHHLQVGFTADNAWRTRFVLEYDYASGDDDPADARDERFDTLFGARRFDFGPTGIYGALARANLSSPAIRLEAKPGPALDGFVGYRAVWLASARDALTTAGLQDPTGASGDFVGHQLEARIRYRIVPENVELELGGAWLAKGRFLKTAPNVIDTSDTTYVYAGVALEF